jgi:hypothetical protein
MEGVDLTIGGLQIGRDAGIADQRRILPELVLPPCNRDEGFRTEFSSLRARGRTDAVSVRGLAPAAPRSVDRQKSQTQGVAKRRFANPCVYGRYASRPSFGGPT